MADQLVLYEMIRRDQVQLELKNLRTRLVTRPVAGALKQPPAEVAIMKGKPLAHTTNGCTATDRWRINSLSIIIYCHSNALSSRPDLLLQCTSTAIAATIATV